MNCLRINNIHALEACGDCHRPWWPSASPGLTRSSAPLVQKNTRRRPIVWMGPFSFPFQFPAVAREIRVTISLHASMINVGWISLVVDGWTAVGATTCDYIDVYNINEGGLIIGWTSVDNFMATCNSLHVILCKELWIKNTVL